MLLCYEGSVWEYLIHGVHLYIIFDRKGLQALGICRDIINMKV